MRGTKFQRLAAILLCVAMLLGNATVIASAADTGEAGGSVTDTSLSDIKALLNAISYSEYAAKNEDIAKADAAIEVQIDQYVVAEGDEDKGFEMREVKGENALYTPENGSVSWTVEVPETAKYAIKIEYYPPYNEENADEGTSRATSIERILQINDTVPFAEARFLTLAKNWVNEYQCAVYEPDGDETAESIAQAAKDAGFESVTVNEDGNVEIAFPSYMTQDITNFTDAHALRFFLIDVKNNEIRPSAVDSPEWMTYYLKDSSGYYSDNFEVVFNKGTNKITLEGQTESMLIKAITLYPYESLPTYEEYIAGYEGVEPGQDTIKLEAEEPTAVSNKTVYPVEERSCAINSPSDVTRSVLNTLGGDKWATAGQWVEYRFQVSSSGMYDIVSRFRQDLLDGMYTCRSMYLYSDGLTEGQRGYYDGVPFAEALKLVYDYSSDWQVTALSAGEQYDSNGDGEITGKDDDITYSVYLEAGTVYTVRFEVTLGKMGDVVRRVQDILSEINAAYLNIIRLTGTIPDKYRDYDFNQVMPDTMQNMVVQSWALVELADELTELAGGKSSNAATLEKVARLLEDMGTDEDAVAKNLENLKTYIGTLGTFLSDAQTQPLQLDYILIQPAGADLPEAKPGFFEAFFYEMGGFFQSFFRDYNSMGALDEENTDSTEVWLATARDQSQVIRNLINNDLTPNQGIAVDLKLVAAGTLLPSILAGSGPDVYLGLGQADVINYAIRSALINIEGMEGFDTYVEENFNDAAMLVLGIEDADETMHYYGLPETQNFPMMFVRTDILADLGLEVPKTWDDIETVITDLGQNMQIGLTTDYKIFLYQQNGDLFADEGMRINLDSQLALASFEKMCNLFTMYSFPYTYDAANRFRTGEMPILIGDYTGTYNQLKVFATEIQGKWEFFPLPGMTRADGTVNNMSISAVTATVMVKGCDADEQADAWAFMKWYTGEDCQVGFANEMVAIMGPSAKQATANKNALASLPWTTAELEQVQFQFSNLGSVPNYPGAYIIDRYANFAFLSAYNDKADPSDALLQYINTINKEIARKRNEFNLETLNDGTTDYKNLITKRLAQLAELVADIRENDAYDASYDALMQEIEYAIKGKDTADAAEITIVAEKVRNLLNELDPNGEIYAKDKIEVMGYDMNDTSLTKDQKRAQRKCFSYEVYRNTTEIVTQLRCCADFLDDVARLAAE